MMRKISILVPLLLHLLPMSSVLDLRAENFIYLYNMMTWKEAQDYCRLHHTDLVTIRNITENHKFLHGWLGLYRNDFQSPWKWSRGDEIANFANWDPNAPRDDHNCAYKYRDNDLWYSDKCSDDHTFTCYDETLVLVKEKKTWEEALNHCRSLKAVDPSRPPTAFQNHHYDLATLLSEDDHVFAKEKAQDSDQGVWMGLRHLAGQWVWTGGEAVQYTDIEGCPSQKTCGILMKDGTVDIRNCMQERDFLCYKRRL